MKNEYYIIVISTIFAVVGWIVDVIFNSILLQKNFFDILFANIPIENLYIRLFVVLSFFIFGMYLSKNMLRKTKFNDNTKIKNKAIESFMSPILIFNLKGYVRYVNPSFLKCWGYNKTIEIVEKPIENFFSDPDLAKDVFNEIIRNDEWTGELLAKKNNGSIFNVQLSATKITDDEGNSIGIMASFIDITEQKLAEKEIQETHKLLSIVNEELERKVEARTREIQKLVDQKNSFINQLSHDLKTPLIPMISLLPALRNKLDEPKDKEILDVVIKNVHFMRDLVGKTIDLVRMNSNITNLDIESIYLKPEIDKVIENNYFSIKNNHIFVKNNVDDNLKVKADRLRIRDLLSHLLTNAIKYSKNDEEACIIIDAEIKPEGVIISIKDNGIGMTKEHIDHIFEEFYKADSSRHNLGSNGLGLSISKKIIEKHGGNIWAESPGLGKGSVFYFTLKK